MLMREAMADLVSVAPELTPKCAALFLILWQARGRFLSYDFLGDRFYDSFDGPVTPRGLQVVLKRLRKTIPAEWPVEIETKTGIGLRVVAPADWTWES